jgi:hypothetical protein
MTRYGKAQTFGRSILALIAMSDPARYVPRRTDFCVRMWRNAG